MVQLGPLMYALLECIDGRRHISELSQCVSEKLGRECDDAHVVALAEKLARQGLLAGAEEHAPPKRNPLLGLRWRVVVTNPAVTSRLTAPFVNLFRPWIVWPVLVAFLAVAWFVVVEEGVAGATSDAFRSPELLLLVVGLTFASAAFHELGHASACRYSGATPGGMGMGLYIVWPAFYTDVTDAYRLPRNDRLRVDLGGLYFNAIVAVVTTGVWLFWRVDALLLVVFLQMLQMVKQLSPIIRADGYHILSDVTGIPDLYAHIGPTLRRLLPWRRREPSALTGRARLLVTSWVLVVVPIIAAIAVGAVLLLPRLLATAWESGSDIATALPDQAGDGDIAGVGLGLVRILGLLLPVLGGIVLAQQLAKMTMTKAHAWADGHPGRRITLTVATALVFCAVGLAWWPSGQYEPIRAESRGTLGGFVELVSSPVAAARPTESIEPVRLTPGTRLAVAMVPADGATKEHPAFFFIRGDGDDPAVALVADGDGALTQATVFPFKLPSAPGPGDTQALSVNTTDGTLVYNVAYALVTVRDGDPVTNKNSAFAFASCNSCSTVAVSFQVVLIVGSSRVVAPMNAAGALNVKCPACVTTAIADQMVVTLRAEPTEELVAKLQAALRKLDALPSIANDPRAILALVTAIQQEIQRELDASGLLANPQTTTTGTTPAGTTSTTTEGSSTAPSPTSTSPTSTTPSAPATTTTTETEPASTAPTATTTTETAPTETTTTETTTETTTTTEPTTTETAPTETTSTTPSG